PLTGAVGRGVDVIVWGLRTAAAREVLAPGGLDRVGDRSRGEGIHRWHGSPFLSRFTTAEDFSGTRRRHRAGGMRGGLRGWRRRFRLLLRDPLRRVHRPFA